MKKSIFMLATLLVVASINAQITLHICDSNKYLILRSKNLSFI